MQVGKFLENIKHAGQNRRAGGKFSEKTLNVQDKIDQNRRAGGKFSEKSINVQGGSFWENQ